MKYITWEEMNVQLDYCYRHKILKEGKWVIGDTSRHFAMYQNKQVHFLLTYKYGNKVTTYQCRKDSDGITQMVNGVDAYATLQKYYKCPDLRQFDKYREELKFNDDLGKFSLSAKPLLYKNEKYNRTRNYAYGYDVNSSYSDAMLQPMPDTTVMSEIKVVGKNEIGFKQTEDGGLVPVFEGHYSFWVFPMIESPFKRFVDVWYNRKATASTHEEKVKAKGMLNYCIGYMQKTNPFLRAAIIYYANMKILNLIDKNTLYCNTDSIVSLTPKNVDTGNGIGQFKLEHEGQFAYVDFNYQWNLEKPSYRAVAKSWFKKGWDILVDQLPAQGNEVEFINYKLRRVKK